MIRAVAIAGFAAVLLCAFPSSSSADAITASGLTVCYGTGCLQTDYQQFQELWDGLASEDFTTGDASTLFLAYGTQATFKSGVPDGNQTLLINTHITSQGELIGSDLFVGTIGAIALYVDLTGVSTGLGTIQLIGLTQSGTAAGAFSPSAGVVLQDSFQGFGGPFRAVSVTATVSAVPEPTSLMLLGSGLGVIGLAAWRRKK